MKQLFEGVAASFISFTRIPVPWPLPDESLQDATWHIPLIGWLNAGLLFLVWRYLAVPLDLKGILILLIPILISGGLHEDGLADAADGLFGGHSKERRLEIMKDSRVGSFGAITLVVYVLAYFLALKNIPTFSLAHALLIAMPLARLQGPVLASLLPYARMDALVEKGSQPSVNAVAKAKAYIGSDRRKILWSILWTLPTAFFMPTLSFAATILLVFAGTTLGALVFFKAKIGGITGDCLGAAIKISELLILWTFAMQFNP